MRHIALLMLLLCVCQPAVAQENYQVIVSAGATRGVSLTDTRARPASEFGIDFYPPILKKKIGLSYVYVYRHPQYGIAKPFAINRTEGMHFIGPIFRFTSEKRVQPWLSGGLMLYGDKISISFFDELLLESKKRKATASASAGINFFLAKGLLLQPHVRFAGIPRPLWQVGGRIGWQFGTRSK